MTPVSILPSFELAFEAFSLSQLKEISTFGFGTAFPASARRLNRVVVSKITVRRIDDMPDNAITSAMLDLVDKVVVCSSAWWRIAEHPS